MKRILAALLLLTLAAPAWAGFDEGLAAYERGDYAVALHEWRPLAEQGVAEAQYELGNLYNLGKGVPEDDTEAVKWYRKSAEQGNADGQIALGASYQYGHGLPQDHTEAAKWYRKSADQGNNFAQYLLGHMYKEGKGVPQDLALAHMWFNIQAGSGRALGRLSRDVIARQMTPAQIAEAQRLAREWMAAFEKRKKK